MCKDANKEKEVQAAISEYIVIINIVAYMKYVCQRDIRIPSMSGARAERRRRKVREYFVGRHSRATGVSVRGARAFGLPQNLRYLIGIDGDQYERIRCT